ncbi:pyruvate, phosphate dikinase, partial [Candidatus Micrarchaeota archaeon]|nr:pyruvate, phosphate dikinase [Candidatus Micrarchaeota archaeon]
MQEVKKYVYSFDEGDISMKPLLGGKGAGLAEMSKIGIPVPPGFTIITEVCDYYNKHNNQFPSELNKQVGDKLKQLEDRMNKKFGDEADPLLVSVRSGAAISMPGMMDTILNLGLNDRAVDGLAKKTGNPRFAWDAYRRFIQMFGDVVMGIEHSKFEHILDNVKKNKGVLSDTELDVDDLKSIVDDYKKLVHSEKGIEFPQNPNDQLWMAIEAVVKSWNNDRAIAYRKINNITGLLGTAINVQAMVFGNMGDNSATGVAFTRNPATGEKKFYGEFLINAQGEDVVAGIRTPLPIDKLKDVMPDVYSQLLEIVDKLEHHFKDMQDIEFTIQNGKLYLLQTRTGKRTANAAVKVAVDMVKEGLITKEEAVMRIDPKQLDQLLHPQIDPVAKQDRAVIAKGLPASPGAAFGKVVFTADKAKDMAEDGEKVILVRTETSPEDIEGMNAAQGILTARGGMTSHAAVVARGMGKCCIAGCGDITVDEDKRQFITKDGE